MANQVNGIKFGVLSNTMPRLFECLRVIGENPDMAAVEVNAKIVAKMADLDRRSSAVRS